MTTQFYIDRAFGHQIWINVKNGIITNFPHSGKMEDKLNEVYKSYSIEKFKEEFEARMKPSFHCVQPHTYASIRRQISSLEGVKSYWHNQKGSIFPVYTEEFCESRIKEIEEKLYEARVNLKAEREILLENHNFKPKY
jgi:hypothetical protein